ncbi:hypothetical protein HGB07_02205 [Candidatus Roizmanbacteria bacterium]|nr:hypothetical protein [Candidatus Roizmanbacteria bacterium]
MKNIFQSKKSVKFAAVGVVIVLSIGLIYGGLRLTGTFSRASDAAPRDVVITDTTTNSAKVTWATGEDTQGVIEYGTSPTALNSFAPELQKGKSHSVDLTLLSPGSSYYFQIRVGEKKFDNNGVPWMLTTKSSDQPSNSGLQPTSEASVTGTTRRTVQTLEMPTKPPVQVPTNAPARVPSEETRISPTAVLSPQPMACTETNCDMIKQKFGKGCTTADYIKCLKKNVTPTSTR